MTAVISRTIIWDCSGKALPSQKRRELEAPCCRLNSRRPLGAACQGKPSNPIRPFHASLSISNIRRRVRSWAILKLCDARGRASRGRAAPFVLLRATRPSARRHDRSAVESNLVGRRRTAQKTGNGLGNNSGVASLATPVSDAGRVDKRILRASANVDQTESPRVGSRRRSDVEDPIEQQILAAGNLSEAQVEAIRGFQRRKGLTFGEAAIALGLVRRTACFWRYRSDTTIRYSTSASTRPAFRVSSSSATSRSAPPRNPSVPFVSALATGPLSQGKNAFAIIGPHARVGVTYFAANLAFVCANGRAHAPYYSNLRKTSLASLFGVDPKTEGLVEALTHGDAELPPVTLDIVPGLSLLVAGATAPHPQELLSAKEFLTLSQNAQRNYGVVIYDTPSALESRDASWWPLGSARRSLRPGAPNEGERHQQSIEGARGLPVRYRGHRSLALLIDQDGGPVRSNFWVHFWVRAKIPPVRRRKPR